MSIDSYTCFVTIVHTFIPNVHRLIFFQASLKIKSNRTKSLLEWQLLKFRDYSTHVLSFHVDLVIVRVH